MSDTSSTPVVGIVLLNWRNYPASSRCLESLARITYPAARTYLVDNASADGSMERLTAEFANRGIEFLWNDANLGFAAGCNVGVRRALADGCGYVLLLNNDCVVDRPDFLEHGVAAAEADPRVGIVGGKILFFPDTTRIWSTGGWIGRWGDEHHVGHGETDRGQYDTAADRTFISGALMLIRRRVLERLGELPEAYFFGKEEWEYSTRAIRAGFVLRYEPSFRVLHEASDSHEWTDPTYVYNGTLSKVLYRRRNLSVPAFALWWAVFRAYLEFLLPLRHALQRGRFLKGMPFTTLRAAMRSAVRDVPGCEKVTLEMLERFRRDSGLVTSPPGRAAGATERA